MEKKNVDGEKKKSIASIPANYVSILHLQKRWMKEKERKHKEDDLVERGLKLEENHLAGGSRRHCGVNRPEKESIDGEESKCVEKDKLEVSLDGENGGGDSRLKKKKKKNQGGSVKEVVKCESNANDVVKDSIGVATQFQDLCIDKRVEEEGREVKGSPRLSNGRVYEVNQRRHDWPSTRTIRPSAMVWVKKEKNNDADGENGV